MFASNPDTDQYAAAVRQGPWGAVDDELAQLGDWGSNLGRAFISKAATS